MRKNTVVLAVLFALICTSPAFADGPPMDERGDVYVDHVVILLKDQQVGQVGRTRKLTFSKEQHDYLRKMHKKYPKEIPIITPHYADCTCGLPVYGIWNRLNRVAIPLIEIGMIENYEREGMWEGTPSTPPRTLEDGGVIKIDAKGDMYFLNKPLRKEEVKKVMQKIADGDRKRGSYLCFNLPPKISKEVDRKVKVLIDEMKSLASKLNMRLCILG
jgi:hypothetical protein